MKYHYIYIRNLETWILYRGKADGVSKVVRDAYQSYKDLEFKAKEVERSDPNLHVKLICLAGKEVFKKKTSYSSVTVSITFWRILTKIRILTKLIQGKTQDEVMPISQLKGLKRWLNDMSAIQSLLSFLSVTFQLTEWQSFNQWKIQNVFIDTSFIFKRKNLHKWKQISYGDLQSGMYTLFFIF